MSQVKLWSKSESESKLFTGTGDPYPVLFLKVMDSTIFKMFGQSSLEGKSTDNKIAAL